MANDISDRDRFFDDIEAEVLEPLDRGEIDEGLKQWESILRRYAGRVDVDAILLGHSMIAQQFAELKYFARAKKIDQFIKEELLADEEEERYEVCRSTRALLVQLMDSRFKLEEDDHPSNLSPSPEPEHERQPPTHSSEDIEYERQAKFEPEAEPDPGPESEPLPEPTTVEEQPQNAFSSLLGRQTQRERQLVDPKHDIEPPKLPRRACSFADPNEKAVGRHAATGQQQPANTRRSSDDTVVTVPLDSKQQPKVLVRGAAGTNGIASTETEGWYKTLSNETHSFVYGKNNVFKGLLKDGTEYERIKIAILDSGIAYTEESDRDKLDTLMDAHDRVADYRDFIDRKDEDDHTEALNDQDGHGTRVAYQLLKTTLTARVYIARVVKKVGKQWLTDETAVAKAIRFAAKSEEEGGWGVDIINMSFGWSGIDGDIRSAIGFARSQDVLMFASTSNFGITKAVDILYPASAPEVISVDAADGLGDPLTLNPKSDADTEKTRFTAPGEGIASPISTVLDKGTSFASPIAAGVAALILEFASQPPLNISKDILEKLKQQEGMIAILRLMTKEKTTERFRFLVPWLLLQGGVTKHGGDGGPLTQRSFIARLIVNKLRIVFKKPVGLVTFPIEKD